MATTNGLCCVCGKYGRLTFEHVPPRAAFNDRPIVLAALDRLLQSERDSGDLDAIKGRTIQKGMGGYTLCGKCNSDTGAWYGSSYKTWVVQGVELLQYARSAPSLSFTYRIYPLLVLKQIVCMFFSANGDQFRLGHPDLVKFVLDRRARFFNRRTKIFAYYAVGNRARRSGMIVRGDFSTGHLETFSEIAFPPFGYILSPDGSCPDERLIDITEFSEYSSDDWCEVHLRLPVLPVYTWVPADFRDRDTAITQIASSASRRKS